MPARFRFVLLLSIFLASWFTAGRAAPGELPPVQSPAVWDWPVSTPGEQGLNSQVINRYLAEIRAGWYGEIHSLLIIRHGFLVSENYFHGFTSGRLHPVYSVTKSVTSLLLGMARDRGFFPDLNRPVLQFFPQYPVIANRTAAKEAMRIVDVLQMRSGFSWNELSVPYTDPGNDYRNLFASPDWIKFMLDQPMSHWPGTRFNYNSGSTTLLGGVLRRETGQEALTLGLNWLFQPLGIDVTGWSQGPGGVTNTGSGLSLRPRDMARLGQMVLQGGLWQGERLISRHWLDQSIKRSVWLSASFTYGYQWWQMPLRPGTPDPLHYNEISIAWGYGGQFIFVIPALDMVVVSTAGDYESELEGAIRFLQDMLAEAVMDRPAATGDVDGDGTVTAADADLLAAVIAGNLEDGRAAGRDWANGDLDGDGRLTFSDYLIIRFRLTGPDEPAQPPPEPGQDAVNPEE